MPAGGVSGIGAGTRRTSRHPAEGSRFDCERVPAVSAGSGASDAGWGSRHTFLTPHPASPYSPPTISPAPLTITRRSASPSATPQLRNSAFHFIRLLYRPQDLLNTSSANDLCLEEYLHPITQGQYALYQVRHQDEFAVAGLRRTDHGAWEIDQIKGPKNAEPSEAMAGHVAAWYQSSIPALHPEMIS